MSVAKVINKLNNQKQNNSNLIKDRLILDSPEKANLFKIEHSSINKYIILLNEMRSMWIIGNDPDTFETFLLKESPSVYHG